MCLPKRKNPKGKKKHESNHHHHTSYTKKNILLDGIFFDQVPTATDAYTLAYMQNLTTYARNAANLGDAVYFNTGATTPAAYYAMADYVNSYEEPLTYTSSFTLSALKYVDPTLASQSSQIIYSYFSDTNQLNTDIKALVSSGLAGLYVTDIAGFGQFPTFGSTLVGDVYSAALSVSSAAAKTKTASSASSTSTAKTTTASSSSTKTTSNRLAKRTAMALVV